MKTAQGFFSNGKSTKPTQRCSTPSRAFIEESNTLSLKFQDLRSLMKKKQASYQNQFMIEEAERVHNFLSQVQQQQRQNNKLSEKNNKARLRREVAQYRNKIVYEFQKQWEERFTKTVQELNSIEDQLQVQQEKQKQNALNEIQQAKNGKGLEKMKFSKTTLQLEDQLRRLAKSQRYDEAYVVKGRWQKAKKQQMVRFISSSVDRGRKQLDRLKKKHQKQKSLVAERLTHLYLKQKQQYELEYQQLLKNAKTYEIDPYKVECKVHRLEKSKGNSSRGKSQFSSVSFGPRGRNYSMEKVNLEMKQEPIISPQGQQEEKKIGQPESQTNREEKIPSNQKPQQSSEPTN